MVGFSCSWCGESISGTGFFCIDQRTGQLGALHRDTLCPPCQKAWDEYGRKPERTPVLPFASVPSAVKVVCAKCGYDVTGHGEHGYGWPGSYPASLCKKCHDDRVPTVEIREP